MVPESPQSSGSPPLSWVVTPETNRWLGLLAYGLYAPLGAIALVLAVGGVAFSLVAVREGSIGLLLLLGVAAVVALARPPVLAAIRSDEVDTSPRDDGWQPSWWGVLAASALCGAAMLAASLHSRVAMGAVAVGSVAAGLLAMALSTEGAIDGDLRLETQYTAVDLRTLSGVRSVGVGGTTILLLSYARGADGFRNPRVLAVPRDRASVVRERLDAGVAADPEADPIGRAERAVVALVALGVLATGPGLALLVGDTPEGGMLVVAYAGAFSLLFAAPMLWYAWKG
ncbi:hypothetical protein [Halolamina sp. C58]|uniref:hypothetical protein n=1 Tax=Halolamina sp. C58 TaxID=3421640 RepID=UPI003EB845CC